MVGEFDDEGVSEGPKLGGIENEGASLVDGDPDGANLVVGWFVSVGEPLRAKLGRGDGCEEGRFVTLGLSLGIEVGQMETEGFVDGDLLGVLVEDGSKEGLPLG